MEMGTFLLHHSRRQCVNLKLVKDVPLADTKAEAVAKKIKSVPVSPDAKDRLIQKLQLDRHRQSLDNLNQVTTSNVADTWLSSNKTRDWTILVEALLTEPGLGRAVSGVLPLSKN